MFRWLMLLLRTDCRRRRVGPPSRARWLPLLFVCLASLAACGSDVNILTLTSEGDANEVMSALLNKRIVPSRTPTKAGIVIAVPSAFVGSALEVLRQAGLPRERFEGLGQTFQKEGMISSPVEERALYIHALSQELANTLSRIDGVVVARVHVVLPEPPGVDRVATPAKAGVFIKYHADQPLDAVLPQLRSLVTHAIPGLSAENVSIALVPAAAGEDAAGQAQGKDVSGVTVAPGSVAKMEFVVVGLMLVAVASIAVGGMVWWRAARRMRKSGESGPFGKSGESGKGVDAARPASAPGNQAEVPGP
ncbi:EscJ/YscJ/HrcJ family type III secretion inner membrane ring protein [Bordetella genomosp. 10]|uniref:Lipoprotein n=2 Tax=Bordetella genomosp. 10 TaxID=1416804 RepID=A0A261SK71_9BORD|nr:EscJ/YscJ/HrcJ family type III secretion inner membrane ring protein [Bordetella genomosp. 10]